MRPCIEVVQTDGLFGVIALNIGAAMGQCYHEEPKKDQLVVTVVSKKYVTLLILEQGTSVFLVVQSITVRLTILVFD